MNTRSLVVGAIAGVAAIGSSALVIAAPAQAAGIKSYNVMEFKPHNGSSGHALWMSGLYNSGLASDKHFVFKDGPGMFTVDEYTGMAHFMGTIVNADAADEIWDIDIKMNIMDVDPSGLKGAGLAPKIDGNTNAENAYAAWDFYDFVDGQSTLTGRGAYEGSSLQLRQKSSNLGIQFGEGANDKTKHLGLSSWFYADGTVVYDKDGDGYTEEYTITDSYGDINVKIDPKPVPEPMSLLGLGAAGFGMIGLKRRKQKDAVG